MLGVLLVSVVSTAAISTSLRSQSYNQIAKNASEAGVAYANACLAANGGVPMWSDAKPLAPGTDCAGNQLPGFVCATASLDVRCSLTVNGTSFISTFSVGLPTLDLNGKASKIKSVGSTQLLRTSNGSIWRGYNQTSVSVPSTYSSSPVAVLVVGGGGGGNDGVGGFYGDGGGGGTVVDSPSIVVTTKSYSVTVGSGGGAVLVGVNDGTGGTSAFGSISASGGTGTPNPSRTGGSNAKYTGGTASIGMDSGAGAGGGANGSVSVAGIGYQSSISGASTYYAGGGGAIMDVGGNPVGQAGGLGGGGAGSVNDGVSGTANTGGGGGGAFPAHTGGSGGSGIVIISYPTSTITASGGVVTTSGGNTIHTFTTSSNFVVGAGQRASCQAILNAGESTGNGMYWIYPSGSTGLNVYCDMTDDGGGWTLVLQNNAAVTTPAPNWTDATTKNTILGTPSSNLTTFDQLVGLSFWNNIGTTPIGTTLRAEVGATPLSISHKATYTVSLSDSVAFYVLNLSNQNIIVGSSAPGLYTTHNTKPFSTFDADHDSNAGNCSTSYANHPWWYTSCWSGNFFAGGGQDKAYWTGSTTDYYDYGSIWLK